MSAICFVESPSHHRSIVSRCGAGRPSRSAVTCRQIGSLGHEGRIGLAAGDPGGRGRRCVGATGGRVGLEERPLAAGAPQVIHGAIAADAE
jgi:hypothetical protein